MVASREMLIAGRERDKTHGFFMWDAPRTKRKR